MKWIEFMRTSQHSFWQNRFAIQKNIFRQMRLQKTKRRKKNCSSGWTDDVSQWRPLRTKGLKLKTYEIKVNCHGIAMKLTRNDEKGHGMTKKSHWKCRKWKNRRRKSYGMNAAITWLWQRLEWVRKKGFIFVTFLLVVAAIAGCHAKRVFSCFRT